MHYEPGLLLFLWILLGPLLLLAIAMHHERIMARRRYRPPAPQPGDDWGDTTRFRPGWWTDEA